MLCRKLCFTQPCTSIVTVYVAEQFNAILVVIFIDWYFVVVLRICSHTQDTTLQQKKNINFISFLGRQEVKLSSLFKEMYINVLLTKITLLILIKAILLCYSG